MSTTKDNLLKAFETQIATLQEAHSYFKNLPDSIIDTVYSVLTNQDIGRYNIAPPLKPVRVEYESAPSIPLIPVLDKNDTTRSHVFKIIKAENKAISKSEIVRRFAQSNPKNAHRALKAVTYALSGLKVEELIKVYNPTKSVKTGMWTLIEWWDGNKLKDDYLPNTQVQKLEYG